MKKIIAIILVLVLACPGTLYAQGTASENNAMTKLGRGLMNILDALVEIPGTMMRTSETEGAASGLTKGALLGVVNTVIRALAGAYETGTFPIPVPSGYEPIMDEPQFLNK